VPWLLGRGVGRGGAGDGAVTSLAGLLVTTPVRGRGGAAGGAEAAGAAEAAEAAAAAGRGEAAGRVAAGEVAAGGEPASAAAPSVGSAPLGAGALAALAARAGFSAGAGSSGETGRRRPSASALRRTRSAWASSIDEEWLFTPMPSDRARSSASLFVSPSSLASS
jgi:hypothetical protein